AAIALLVSVVGASAQKAPSAKPFERFDGCVLTPDEWTDGDSFRGPLRGGRLETFRLYFVDTTESRTRGKRSDEQAAYFGLTRAGCRKARKRSEGFHRCCAAKTVYDSDPRGASFWANALFGVGVPRRRQRSGGTAGKKRSGAYLRNAHAAS